MQQRLFSTVLVAVLFLSGCGSLLASVMCPHARVGALAATGGTGSGAEELDDCCPTTAQQGESTHCPMSKGHAGAGGQDQASSADAATAHHARGSGVAERHDAAAHDARPLEHPHDSCTYCIIRTDNLPAPVSVPEPDASRRNGDRDAPRVERPLAGPDFAFVPPVVPSQGAPPGAQTTTRYLLHSVFLI